MGLPKIETDAKPKRTPGPWRVEEGTTLIWGNCNPDDRTTYGMGYPIAEACAPRSWQWNNKHSYEEQEANAHLIAAAPTMAEALQASLAWINHWDEDRKSGLAPTESSLSETRQLIESTLRQAREG